MKGRFNSSITRVRPVFQQLLRQDPTGCSWLPTLLVLGDSNLDHAQSLARNAGELRSDTVATRRYRDRVLLSYKVEHVPLESCFEKRLSPPGRFLKWLIENPDKMTVRSATEPGASESEKWRARLFSTSKPEDRERAQSEALTQLELKTASGSYREWWAFEGFTEVDCYLETVNSVILIEGKRTEPLSKATMWYPQRNQLVRNLEVAHEIATRKKKEFGVMLITEELIEGIGAGDLDSGLPHFKPHERESLLKHYLGCTTWRAVCDATGIEFAELPNETAEVADQLKAHA